MISHRGHRASEESHSGLVSGQSRVEDLAQFFHSQNWARNPTPQFLRSVNSEGSGNPEQGRRGATLSPARRERGAGAGMNHSRVWASFEFAAKLSFSIAEKRF